MIPAYIDGGSSRGKIIEEWVEMDRLGLMQQMGVGSR
jgi:hypothetical protein